MDEAERIGGGDESEQFNRNEAISAVVDEGFGEEDDDYEDLYNDVNVGEGFLQALKTKEDDVGFNNDEGSRVEPSNRDQDRDPAPPSVVENSELLIPGVGRGEGERKFEVNVGVDGGGGGGGDSYCSLGMKGNDVGMKGSENMNGGTGVGRGGGLIVELRQHSSKVNDVEEAAVQTRDPAPGIGQPQRAPGVNVGNVRNEGLSGQVGVAGGYVNGTSENISGPSSAVVQVSNMVAGPGGSGGPGGGTILYVGDLHWWTTDAELEAELVKYGPVKEVKFFDEKASGKSKGYCQVEFYDPCAAAACKEGMNGHVFNGRPCVVTFASPFSIKKMGDAQMNRNQQTTQQGPTQPRRGQNDFTNNTIKPPGNNIGTGGNYQGPPEQNRNFGRGSWGRGSQQGMGNRGPIGPIRNRPGGMGGRGMMGNGGGSFGSGMGPGPLMPPQPMMGQGFDPGFGGPMGRMGNYGGFPGAPIPPFQGLLSSFPPVPNVGLPGVAPHVNPAFFGRGMPMNGMGMMPNAGNDGPNMGMWSDTNMGVWGGDEHGGRPGESSYGEEVVSDHQYREAGHERISGQNPVIDKDRDSEKDFSGTSDRRYRDERDMPRQKEHDTDWSENRHRDDRDGRERERIRSRDRERSRDRDRERYRDDRDRHVDHHHKYRDHEAEYDEDFDRGRSSRTHSKSRLSHEEEMRSRSRDADYGKRRRITSE